VVQPIQLLLIEDNAGDILLIRQALAGERCRISIHVAVDGQQALEILAARQFKPDLIILDLNLPKVSGLSFLERCQLDVPVVVFTALTGPRNQLRSLELGVKEFVQKSTDLGEYVSQVSQIVRDWGHPRTDIAGTEI
jgi:CheY-like chemotaxis protein